MALVAFSTGAQAQSAGGIQWTAPGGWKSEGARPMRAATYRVPAAPGDKEDGECAVFYFGPGQGGGVEDNLKRWIGQFENAQGEPKRAKQTINGLNVTTIDLAGAYTGAGGPMAAAKVSKPGYRLLGGIVEAQQGAVFFKFTGPAKTVAAQQGAFQGLLKSVRR
ncbi:MAG: hypothetical protein HY238_01570 [Acidobacteria bacterium]|nr:hypothetical protein [Acidobacteriota bacterium]